MTALRAVIVLGLAGIFAGHARAGEFRFAHEDVMGTSLELRVQAASGVVAIAAERATLDEIDRLSLVFSGYDRSSELRRWLDSRQSPRQLSRELIDMLAESDLWRTRSGGAFEPRVEVLSRLWARAEEEGRLPDDGERKEALALLSGEPWRIEGNRHLARTHPDVPISLNAIAKGAIVEKACARAMAVPGVSGVLLNAGGDMRAAGDFRAVVGVADPFRDSETTEPLEYLELSNRAMATSGDYQRGFTIRGRRYSHIFDPRSGEPAGRVAQATVLAPRSSDADALATIFNVVSADEARRLAAKVPGVEFLIVDRDGTRHESAGWSRLVRPAPASGIRGPVIALLATGLEPGPQSKGATRPQAKANAKPSGVPKMRPMAPEAADAFGRTHEMVIKFDLNNPQDAAPRYRKPYVAVWVEDKDGFPVRTLALWVSFGGAGPWQWLPDVKRWHRADRGRMKVETFDPVATIARATRPPGSYSVIWDGKDDHGRFLPRGSYTIHIEAAREHGTYQEITKKYTLGGAAISDTFPGGVELKGASIAYRPRPAKP